MSNKRKMLRHAAKACGITVWSGANHQSDMFFTAPNGWNEKVTGVEWNPLTNSTDCAAMCAKLEIDTEWHIITRRVLCSANFLNV